MCRYGFIAQELEKVMPELVRDHKDFGEPDLALDLKR